MMTNTEERHCPRYFFQERVGKTLLFSCRRAPSPHSRKVHYRKKFLNVLQWFAGYSNWTEFEWDHCLLLEVYDWWDPRCDDATLISDESHYSRFEVAAKIYVDSAVHFVKVRLEDFTEPSGEDENV